MEISSIGPIRPSVPFPMETDPANAQPKTFGEMLEGAINHVNNLDTVAEAKSTQLALGEIQDTHEVMLAIQKATISLQLVTEIRNKVVEAYQSIMRMAM